MDENGADMTVHECPGGCGANVPYHLLACRICWRRLPAHLKADVNLAWRNRTADPDAHTLAVEAAYEWYRGNPA
jgi:hypothetical protein